MALHSNSTPVTSSTLVAKTGALVDLMAVHDGGYNDKGEQQKSGKPSKIWPVKVHRGKQIYDPVNMTLIQPKLWDKEAGNGAYWTDFDWDQAARLGSEAAGIPYSGEYGFAPTEMYWTLTHMVQPKEQALQCA